MRGASRSGCRCRSSRSDRTGPPTSGTSSRATRAALAVTACASIELPITAAWSSRCPPSSAGLLAGGEVHRPENERGPGASAGASEFPISGRLRLLAARAAGTHEHLVSGVDHAAVGVVAAVHGVVAGNVVAGLQQVVPVLVLEGERAVARVGAVHAEAVVALAADQLVIVEGSGDEVVVGLALDRVLAVVAVCDVVALSELDDVVSVLRVDLVGAGACADDVITRRSRDEVVRGRSLDRAVRGGAGVGAESTDEGGDHGEAHRGHRHEDRT